MTGRFLPLCAALLATACATADSGGSGDPIDAAVGDPIDAPADPIDAPADPIDAPADPIDGPPGCVPTDEVCDGEDNDCDDSTDEGNPGGGATCATGSTGPCGVGTDTCMGGEIVCVQTGQPATELCNGVDDDCNPATADGSAEAWFGQRCDGADLDACNEGTMACNGAGQVCGDVTGDSNRVVDGSFEAGYSSGNWVESSTLFVTPLCTIVDCGQPPGHTGPRTGTFWTWLGGTVDAESAFVSQAMTIPVGTATLTFYFEAPACGVGGAAETFQVKIDGTDVFTTNNLDASCNTQGYQLKTVDVSGFANGGSHTLEFRGTFNTGQPTSTNFMVDDVRLVSCP